MADLAYSITAQNGRFCLTRGGKVIKSGKGYDLATSSPALADLTLAQMLLPRPRVFALGYWQAVLDAEAPEIEHMQRTLREGLAYDQLIYPAPEPADFVQQQQQVWAEAKAWLGNLGVYAAPASWQGEDTLLEKLTSLKLPALVWLYGASRLLQSTALGLWALNNQKSAEELVKAGYSDEFYQQARYKPDDEVLTRLSRIQADLADLCLLRSWAIDAETL